MKISAKLIGISPYSPSKPKLTTEKGENETYEDYERRTWKEHLHLNSKKQIVLSLFALKPMLDSVAKYLGEKIAGQGNRTYTQLFKSSVIFQGDHPLLLVNNQPITEAEVSLEKHGAWIYAHADGKRTCATRVNRLFPQFDNWSANVEIETIDPRITRELLIRYLCEAGMKGGLGRFRPQNGGFLGRFKVEVDGKEVDAVLSTDKDE